VRGAAHGFARPIVAFSLRQAKDEGARAPAPALAVLFPREVAIRLRTGS
jgi:hypothetical protein